MHAIHQCNAMIEAALKVVLLCSLYWAWITITVRYRGCAIVTCLHCKSFASLVRSKAPLCHCI